jgi:hypothetical protein
MTQIPMRIIQKSFEEELRQKICRHRTSFVTSEAIQQQTGWLSVKTFYSWFEFQKSWHWIFVERLQETLDVKKELVLIK